MSVLDTMSIRRQVVGGYCGVFQVVASTTGVFVGPNEYPLPGKSQAAQRLRNRRIKLILLFSIFLNLEVVTLTKSKNNRQKISSLHESLTLTLTESLTAA